MGLPDQIAEIKDVHGGIFACEPVLRIPEVAAYHHHLSVPDVAGCAAAACGDGLPALVDFDPDERRDREDPHVVFLLLAAVGEEVLAYERVRWSVCY